MMFEDRSIRQRTIIYAGIALLATTIIALVHFFLQGYTLLLVVIMAVIEFFLIFYILYLPLKVKKAREKEK